ncbi:MAG: glycosyltransferase family 2 protein [Chitinophagaceae bacterium]|nr:MAG: glycosyltransferase family 2 protein [Chitinophagaceae bacterium]
MKVCGFSFVRNGVKFDYPFVEAIRSILPLCDEVFIAVGASEDTTLETVRAIDPRVTVIETKWDESLRQGGQVFASETNKAFQAIPLHYDWAFYIQGDEVVHEQYIPAIRKAMEETLDDDKVDGLLFNFLHFFGSYDYIGAKYSWYRREIRIVRNRKDIYSFRDAQGFRQGDNQKLTVKLVDASIYHYGWVRQPRAMLDKIRSSTTLYRGSLTDEEKADTSVQYEYENAMEPVVPFTGTHPALMKERIQQKNWPFTPNPLLKYASTKDKVKRLIAKWTGWFPGEYKNYKRLRS